MVGAATKNALDAVTVLVAGTISRSLSAEERSKRVAAGFCNRSER